MHHLSPAYTAQYPTATDTELTEEQRWLTALAGNSYDDDDDDDDGGDKNKNRNRNKKKEDASPALFPTFRKVHVGEAEREREFSEIIELEEQRRRLDNLGKDKEENGG